MVITISMDTIGRTSKTTDRKEISRIRCRSVDNRVTGELKDFAHKIGDEGHTFFPALLEGGTKSENFVSMRLFVLDFDSGVSFETIRKRAEENELPILFAYYTFSSSQQIEKFRVAFLHVVSIIQPKAAEMMLYMFHKVFPECDPSCKDIARMFFGGKGLFYYNKREERFTLVQLLLSFRKSINHGGHYARNLKDFADKFNIEMVNGNLMIGDVNQMSVFGEFCDSSLIIYIGDGQNTPFFYQKKREGNKGNGDLHQGKTSKRKHRIDFNKMSGCSLLDDFISGEEFHHNQKFAVLTNLLQVTNGSKFFLDILKQHGTREQYEKWEKDINYCKNYYPQKCGSDFCPYYDECNGCAGTIIGTLLADKSITYDDEQFYTDIETASQSLKENMETAFESDDRDIHLVKAQTAIGKTSMYCDLICAHPDKKFIVALPTNILKEDVAEKLADKGISFFMTSSVRGNCLIPEEIREDIQAAHDRGIHSQGKVILKEYLDEIRDDKDKKAVIEDCEKILDGVKGETNEQVIVTTHAYYLHMPLKLVEKYTVIIDEDILYLQLLSKANSISQECLEELRDKGAGPFGKIAQEILDTPPGEYKKCNWKDSGRELTIDELDELEHWGENDNINDLLCAGAFVREAGKAGEGQARAYYLCVDRLPPVKHIILSATLNGEVYRRYFSGREIHEYPTISAAYKGKLKQYTFHSMGRSDLEKKPEVFNAAKKIAGNPDINVISFKSMGKLNDLNLHFGNAIGVNGLKGKDLVIIGTPFKNSMFYKLTVCYLGGLAESSQNLHRERITYKGYTFPFMTYEEGLLREIEMYSMESELEQCVGRARLLREDCTVYLFSSFPCEQAELICRDYLKFDVDGEDSPC